MVFVTGRVLNRLSYPAAWHIISQMVTKSEPWHIPLQICLRLTKQAWTVRCWASNVTGWEKCAVRPGLEPDTLFPQWWLSPNLDIHPHKLVLDIIITVNSTCQKTCFLEIMRLYHWTVHYILTSYMYVEVMWCCCSFLTTFIPVGIFASWHNYLLDMF